MSLTTHPYAQTIWLKLLNSIGNAHGTAALMGNLQAESGLYPDRVQGDVPYSSYSQEYTAKVNSGVISEYDFVHNGPGGGGYGLAQWTFYTRKQALYDYWQASGAASIGNVFVACEFLIKELKESFPSIWNTLKNATSIREASDVVLHDFENPALQTEAVEIARAEMGREIYNTFSGLHEDDDDEPGGGGGGTVTNRRTLSKLLLYAVATDLI